MPRCRRAVFATIASASSTPAKSWRWTTSRSIALRKKKDSSIARAAELVSEGKADALVSLGNTGGIFAAAHFQGRPHSRRGPRLHRHGHSAPEQRICPAGRRRERGMQAAAPRAIRRDGQRLFARSSEAQKSARRHLEHRHRGFQGQRTDARSLQALQKTGFEFHRQRRGPRSVQGPCGRGRVRRLCRQHRFENRAKASPWRCFRCSSAN